MNRSRPHTPSHLSVVGAMCLGGAFVVSPAFAQHRAIQLPPVLGFAGVDNEYREVRTLIASFDLDADPSGVTLTGDAAFTTVPGQVIAGARSARLAGDTAMLEIDPAALNLQGGEIYALEFDYRILDGAGEVSVLTVTARWGIAGELHSDPWGLRPAVVGNAGTLRRQFRFGADGYPTFQLFTSGDAAVLVDNLRVWRLHAEAKKAEALQFSCGFPRLGDFNFDSPHAGAIYNHIAEAPYEQVLSRFDFVNGVQLDHTLGDTSWVERMREANPDLVMVPFRHTFVAPLLAQNQPIGGTAGMRQLFARAIPDEWIMRNPEGEPLLDQIFEGNTQLDPTWYCPRVDGLTFAEFMTQFLSQTVLPSGLWNGIHFDQAEWFPNPLLAQTVNGPLPPIDMDRDGIADPKPLMFGAMRAAFEDFFTLVRRQFGSTRVIFGNPGRIPLNAGVLATLSGWQEELFTAYEILPDGNWDTTRSARWHDFLRNYLVANRWAPMPQVLNVQSTGRGLGVENGLTTGHGYPNRVPEPEQRDFQRMRLGLTTTLLGNGFFGYDFVDNTTPPVWFDEYALNAQGHPTTALSGKGYLGQPLGAPAEITRPEPVILETGFEEEAPSGLWLGAGAAWTIDPAQVIAGLASVVVPSVGPTDYLVFQTDPSIVVLEQGKTYDLTATFRVLEYLPETYASFLAMGIGPDAQAVDFTGRAYAYHQDIEGPGQTITLRSQVKITQPWSMVYAIFGDRGTVAVDSLRLTEVRGGAFRRDFEGGIAIVNPTPEPITLTQDEVAGPLGRTNIRRIAGVQDPAVNNGLPVTNGLTIPPADGIVLLAARIGAPPLAAPTTLGAMPDPSEPAIELVWDAPHQASRAGHFIEYKIAEGAHWDRFELEGPGNYHRVRFLQPGTEYDVRISAFDFLGTYTAFTDPIRVTTAGVAPVRARIASIDPMVRGAFVVLSGLLLSEATADLAGAFPFEFQGTRVTVNGVPARLAYVSPTLLAFGVPDSVAFGESIVRVYRDGVPSAGFIADVLDPTPPACPADINGDDRTNIQDFLILAANFGTAVAPHTGGDLSGDGLVSIQDVNVLAGDFGCGS